MSHDVWHLYLRDATLNLVGEIATYSSFIGRCRMNDVGSWTLALPADDPIVSLVQWGGGIALFRDQDVTVEPIFSGPIGRMLEAEGPDGDTIELSGPDDNWYLTTRCVPPNPLGPPYVDEKLEYTGIVADQIMGTIVANQLAATAKAERRLPLFNVAPPSGVGAVIDASFRFDPLLDRLKTLAVAGGGLVFQVKFAYAPNSGALSYMTWMPNDRRRSVVFSVNRGTSRGGSYEEIMPEANYVYALGKGQGFARDIAEGGNNESITEYRVRIEKVVDARGAESTTELELERDAALVERAAIRRMTVDPLENESFRFGRDYGIGDRVTSVVRAHTMEGYITGYEVRLDENGGSVLPQIDTELGR